MRRRMTKEELKKRLKFIKATPLVPKIPPREVSRRNVNKVSNLSEYDDGAFDSFFDFEEDLSDLESARLQVERIETARINAENKARLLEMAEPWEEDGEEEEPSFLVMEEDDEEEKSGDESSFFIFEEEIEEVIEESSEENVEEVTKELSYTEVKGFEFQYCKYIKSNGEQCKRQSPKNGDHCGTHRKMLKKQKA